MDQPISNKQALVDVGRKVSFPKIRPQHEHNKSAISARKYCFLISLSLEINRVSDAARHAVSYKRSLPLFMFPARTHLRAFRSAKQSLCKHSTNAATEELVYPDSQSSNHHDLKSFLEYATRIGMDTKSSTYVGTHYEYIAQTALERLGMSLKRIGGKSDYGIDLLGTWSVPSAPQPLKVLIQCKAFARKIEPSQARELEGAFVGAPIGWRGSGVLGLLVSQRSATKGVREALGRSRWPMGYILCGADGKILQMLWNRRSEQEGLEGLGVGLKYAGGDRNEKKVVLMWKGEPIPR